MMDALLGDPEVIDAVAVLSDGGSPEERAARAAWSVVAEPGDGVAGALIGELGAAEALRFAVATSSEDRAVAGASEQARGAIAEARARWKPRADPRAVRDALVAATHVGARLVVPGDATWPSRLADLGVHAPAALWVRGDPAHLVAGRAVSVVGARAATAYGEHVAAELAGDLAAGSAVVVSGGAYGIDGAAHRAALGTGGVTVAFLAGGVDRAYPAGHQQLFARITTTGTVVSELPCGAAPTKWRFLARNRLIAALGDATVVVEAGWRSGSLNTAGHAAALGRPLGAVPGPVTSAASAGCHRLMREYDARCVTSAAEVRELAGYESTDAYDPERPDHDRTRLLDALSPRSRRSVMDLARRSGLSQARVTALLGILSLEGIVAGEENGWRRVTTAG